MSEPAPPPPRAPGARLLGAAALVSGLLVTLVGSGLTGPAFDEERRIVAVRRAVALVRTVGDQGLAGLGASSAAAAYQELGPFGLAPGLLSGYLGEVLRAAHVVDALTASRFGFLVVTGLAPFALFLLVERACGVRAAALASCLLLAMPRWTHAAAAAREPAIVAALWLALAAAYARSVPPGPGRRARVRRPRSVFHGALFGLLLGASLSVSRATLALLPLLALHYFVVSRRPGARPLRRGIAPVPAAFLWALPLAPVALVACEPRHLRGNAGTIAAWLFGSLAPSVEALTYRGVAVTAKRVPPFYALDWLWCTTPLPILLLAAAGAAFALRGFARSRAIAGDMRLGLLSAMVLATVTVFPAFAPDVFVLFPPRTEAALPFVAVFAALGLESLAALLVTSGRPRIGRVLAPLVSTACVALSFVEFRTAGAAFNLVAGGARGVMARRHFTVGDGSELSGLGAAIDRLGRPRVTADSPEVPKGYFALLTQVGRLKTRVEPPKGGAAELTIRRGAMNGSVARVSRADAPLWEMSRR